MALRTLRITCPFIFWLISIPESFAIQLPFLLFFRDDEISIALQEASTVSRGHLIPGQVIRLAEHC